MVSKGASRYAAAAARSRRGSTAPTDTPTLGDLLASPAIYERWLAETLARVLRVPTTKGWFAFQGMAMYSPRVDVAVGPFSIEEGSLGNEYDELVTRFGRLVSNLRAAHERNVDGFDFSDPAVPLDTLTGANWNARCFMAIEVENQNSRKHLMGSAINAAALGRIGLAVGWDEDRVVRFLRMRRYLTALLRLRKTSFRTTNLLILSAEQLAEIVLTECRRRRIAPPPPIPPGRRVRIA